MYLLSWPSLKSSSDACNLNFYPKEDDLQDSFGRIDVEEEGEKITRQQAEEDIRIYGRRPAPPLAVDFDENERLIGLPSERKDSELEAGVEHPTRLRNRSDGRISNHENITAMDWNAGESPLSTWLNQSAIPATTPATMPFDNHHQDPRMSKSKELLNQEKKDIEVFKYVHIATTSEPATAPWAFFRH